MRADELWWIARYMHVMDAVLLAFLAVVVVMRERESVFGDRKKKNEPLAVQRGLLKRFPFFPSTPSV